MPFLIYVNYIIHKRNIYNEYVHTSNELNITKDIFLPVLIQLLLIIILSLALIPFLCYINIVLGELMNSDNDFSKFLTIVSIIIILLTFFINGFFLYFNLILAIKYSHGNFFCLYFLFLLLFFTFS